MHKHSSTALFVLLLAVLQGCVTVPETGRSAINLVPEGQLDAMAASGFLEMKQSLPISADAQANAMVERVGRRIVSVARESAPHLPPVEQWEFVVFDQPDVINAFAMPGGRIGIYTGMLKLVDDDHDLAVVMGHEVAHVAARHGNERVSHELLFAGGGVLAAIAAGQHSSETQAIVMAAYGVGTMYGMRLPFSRSNESEADHIGLLYAARAGYDPQRAIRFWQRMGEASAGSAPAEFLSTHPGHQTRIQRLNESMPQALSEYAASPYRTQH